MIGYNIGRPPFSSRLVQCCSSVTSIVPGPAYIPHNV